MMLLFSHKQQEGSTSVCERDFYEWAYFNIEEEET